VCQNREETSDYSPNDQENDLLAICRPKRLRTAFCFQANRIRDSETHEHRAEGHDKENHDSCCQITDVLPTLLERCKVNYTYEAGNKSYTCKNREWYTNARLLMGDEKVFDFEEECISAVRDFFRSQFIKYRQGRCGAGVNHFGPIQQEMDSGFLTLNIKVLDLGTDVFLHLVE